MHIVHFAIMSTLRDFLTRTGTNQADFAKRVGTNQAVISRLTRNEVRPTLKLAVAIERETGGEIKAASWVDMPVIPVPPHRRRPRRNPEADQELAS